MDLTQLRVTCFVEGFRIGPVAAHAIVQTRAAGGKAGRFRVVHAMDQAHELAGDIAVEPRRAEGVFHRQDAWRKYHEVDRINAGCVALRLQYQKNRWIGMVETDRTNRIEAAQIVFVGRVIAVPSDHIERRMIDCRRPQVAGEFRDQFEAALAIFIPGHRR